VQVTSVEIRGQSYAGWLAATILQYYIYYIKRLSKYLGVYGFCIFVYLLKVSSVKVCLIAENFISERFQK